MKVLCGVKYCAIILFSICFLSANFISAQVPQFINPIDISIRLSANFGDIRDDHYHTGIDIRTNEEIGHKVYAAADGYISRIKISLYGYGKVLYITHPSGYITVYGHLDHFTPALDKYVRTQQYSSKKFDVEMFPKPEVFPVKQGDLIAYSGNTGGSSGPHLHFEIRDASGETFPLNPEKFLRIDDSIAPRFINLYEYNLSACCGLVSAQSYVVVDTDSVIHLIPDTLIINDNNAGFGVDAEDFMNTSNSDLGVYQLDGFEDGSAFFSMKFDRLSFENGRYVNAHADYRLWQQSDTIVRRLFLQPADYNSLYDVTPARGKILLTDTFVHDMRIRATDEHGNFSDLNFHVKYSGKKAATELPTSFSAHFLLNQPNAFQTDSMKLTLPEHALYDELYFNYSVSDSGSENYLTPIHHVHDPFTPLHDAAELQLLPRFIPDSLKKKGVIVYRNQRNRLSARNTHWEGNYLVTKIRDFGDYFAMLDTIPPVVSVVGLRQNHYLRRTKIVFVAADNLSGVASYNGYLDGKWILLEYSAKSDKLICNLDRPLAKGKHRLRLVVTDEVNNKTVYTFSFRK